MTPTLPSSLISTNLEPEVPWPISSDNISRSTTPYDEEVVFHMELESVVESNLPPREWATKEPGKPDWTYQDTHKKG